MAVDPKLKAAVKEALLEIEADKRHAKVHGEIIRRMHQAMKPGMGSMCKCGVCGEVLVLNRPKYPPGEVTLV
jgi:hypothetical protein